MTDIASLSAQLGLDEAAVRHALESERAAADAATPWYVLLLLGLGAWITALIMVVFVALLLNVAFDIEEPDIASAAIGVGMFLCGFLIEAKGKASVFAQQFAIALVAAGAAIAAVSLWVESDSAWNAAAAAAAMTAIDIWRGRNAQQQFLLAALAVGFAIAAIDDATTAGRVDIVALALPIGVALYLRPPRVDMRATATALLLAMPFDAMVTDSLYSPDLGFDNWPARAIALAVVVALAWLRVRGSATPPDHLRHLLAALAAAVVCLLLPPGGSAGLAILMLAFTLGHWPLAIIGALLEVYFVPRFYYDLELSLLTKSWILVTVGVALLASYAALRPRRGVPS